MRLLEREADLATLRAHADRARSGHGGLVLVEGESGAGKTSLVNAFVDEVDVPVLWGVCDPLTTPRPLGPVHDVAHLLGEQSRRLLYDGGVAHEIFAAVVDDLRQAPYVLVVDDLHWADQGSLDLLRFLLRRLARTPSLVVGTFRQDDVGPAHPLRNLLGDVARSENASLLSLGR